MNLNITMDLKEKFSESFNESLAALCDTMIK